MQRIIQIRGELHALRNETGELQNPAQRQYRTVIEIGTKYK